MSIRRTSKNGNSSSKARAKIQRLRDKALRLSERIKASASQFLSRREARRTWWQLAFRTPLVGFYGWVFSRAATLWAAYMTLLGFDRKSSKPALATRHGEVRRSKRDKQRGLKLEGLEQRQLMAADFTAIAPGTLTDVPGVGTDTAVTNSATPNVTATVSSASNFLIVDTNSDGKFDGGDIQLTGTKSHTFALPAPGTYTAVEVASLPVLGSNLPTAEDTLTITKDTTAPTVAIVQHVGQVDPAPAGVTSAKFTAVFSEPINPATFTAADISVGGTSMLTGKAISVTQVAPNNGTTFDVTVSWTSATNGTIIPSVLAGGVQDLATNANTASFGTAQVTDPFVSKTYALNTAALSQFDTGAVTLPDRRDFATAFDNFTLAAATPIASLSWVGKYDAVTAGLNPTFRVVVYPEVAGQPGPTGTTLFSGKAGEVSLGSQFFRYNATFPSFVLPAGNYWVSVVAELDYSTIGWGLAFSALGNTASFQDFQDFNNKKIVRTPETIDFAVNVNDASVTVNSAISPYVVTIDAVDTPPAEGVVDGGFVVALNKNAVSNVVITYAVGGNAVPAAAAGGTLGNPNDYELLSGTVTITAGSKTAFIDVKVFEDALIESSANETVVVQLTSIDGSPLTYVGPLPTTPLPGIAPAGTLAEALFIVDNDASTISINSSDTSINTENSVDTGVFNVVLTKASSTETQVWLNIPQAAANQASFADWTATLTNGARLATSNSTATITNGSRVGNVAAITTAAPHDFIVGQRVSITGAGAPLDGGPYTITSVPTPNTFTFASTGVDFLPGPLGGPYALAGTVTTTSAAPVFSITGRSIVSNSATITTNLPHSFVVGQQVVVSGTNADFNGTRTITSVTATSFSFASGGVDQSAGAAGSVTTVSNARLIIPAGIAGTTITVSATPDTEVEQDEQISITLASVMAPGLPSIAGSSNAVVTIIDDDAANVSLAPASVLTGTDPDTNPGSTLAFPNSIDGKFVVSMTNKASQNIVVNYSVSGPATAAVGTQNFFTDFSSGLPSQITKAAGGNGQVNVVSDTLELRRQSNTNKMTSPNSAVLDVDLSAARVNGGAVLTFTQDRLSKAAEGDAETDQPFASIAPGATFPDAAPPDVDGVAISVDGLTWHPVLNLGADGTYTINLEKALYERGLEFNKAGGSVKVRFLQFDNNTVDNANYGRRFDNIRVVSGDYDALSGTVTILAGNNTASIDLKVINDLVVEGNENVTVTLTGLNTPNPDVQLDPIAANLTQNAVISDADTAVAVITNGGSGNELGLVPGKFNVSLTNAHGLPMRSSTNTTIPFQLKTTALPAATLGIDYTFGGAVTSFDSKTNIGTLLIPAGETQAVITVNVLQETDVEIDEFVTLQLLNAKPNLVVGDPQISVSSVEATVTIQDEDAAFVRINDAVSGMEPGTQGQFVVDLVRTTDLKAPVAPITPVASNVDTVVTYTVSIGTATGGAAATPYGPTDYNNTTLTGTLTITAGQTSAILNIPVLDDLILEPTETVTVTLDKVISGDPSVYVLASQQSDSVDILDNDTLLVKVAPAVANTVNAFTSATWSAGVATITTTGNHNFLPGQVVTVNFSSSAGFNGTYQLVSVTANTFTFLLAGPVANDPAPVGTASSLNAREAGANNKLGADTPDVFDGRFIISLDSTDINVLNAYTALNAGNVVVTYSLSGTASNGIDYQTLNGTATILSGQSTTEVRVDVINDGLFDPNETVTLTLTGVSSQPALGLNGKGVVADTNPATVTIVDDENGGVSLTVTKNARESNTNGELTFTLSGPSAFNTVVTYAVTPFGAAPIATQGVDHNLVSGQVTFTAGQTVAKVVVPVLNDAVKEGIELIPVQITGFAPGGNGGGYGIITPGVVNVQILEDQTVDIVNVINGKEGAVARSIVRAEYISANLVRITTSVPHGYESGQTVAIGGVGANYNGTFAIHAATPTTFDYIRFGSGAVVTNAGTATPQAAQFVIGMQAPSSAPTVVTYVIVPATGDAQDGVDFTSLAPFTAVIPAGQTTVPVALTVNDDTIIENTENLTIRLVSVFNAADPDISIGAALPSTAAVDGQGIALIGKSKTATGGLATLTTARPHGFVPNQQVFISGTGDTNFDGLRTIASVSGNSFTFTSAGGGFVAPTTTTGTVESQASVVGTVLTSNVATLTTSGPHGFRVGQAITVTGAANPAYDGAYVVTAVTANSISYALTSADIPAALVAGGTVRGDAGNLPVSAQSTNGSFGLTTITGALTAVDGQDMYKIYIDNPLTFKAESTGFDTQLFLFDVNGKGITSDDDGISFAGGSSISYSLANKLSTSPAGWYYLAISGWDSDPTSGGFGMWLFDTNIAPNGVGANGAVDGWTGFGAIGTYTITLTSASFAGYDASATLSIFDNDAGYIQVTGANGKEATSDVVFTITQSAQSSTDTVVTYTLGTSGTPSIPPGTINAAYATPDPDAGADHNKDYSKVYTATISAGQTSVQVTVSVVDDLIVEEDEVVTLNLIGSAPVSGDPQIKYGTVNGPTITFQQGAIVGGVFYSGTADTFISESLSASNFGTNPFISISDDSGTERQQGLIRFDGLVGANLVPLNSVLSAASLQFGGPLGVNVRLHDALQAWTPGITWNSSFGGNGIQPNGTTEASTTFLTGNSTFNVLTAAQKWINGGANNGWAILPNDLTGKAWDADSSEGTTPPSLTLKVATGASVVIQDNDDAKVNISSVINGSEPGGPVTTISDINNKQATGTTATLTTASVHGLLPGQTVVVAIGDATFDGTYVLTAGTVGSTIEYTKGNATNVASTPVTVGFGSVTRFNQAGRAIVSIDKVSSSNTVVRYTIADGTATGGGIDHNAPTTTQTLTIPAGHTSATIYVEVTDDLTVEGQENVTVTLQNVNYTGAASAKTDPQIVLGATKSAIVNIDDNDTGSLSVTTAANPFTPGFAGSENNPVTAVVINKELTGGLATITTDAPHTYTVGEQVLVNIGDPVFDGEYVVVATAGNTFSYVRPFADVPFSSATGTAANQPWDGKFVVSTTTASATATVIPYQIIVNGLSDAKLGTDYQLKDGPTVLSGVVTLPALQTSVDITIDVLEDLINEGHETITIKLLNPSSGLLSLSTNPLDIETTATIADDDALKVSIVATDNLVNENDGGAADGVFTVTLDTVSDADTRIVYRVVAPELTTFRSSAITTAAVAGNVITLTTPAAHGFVVGQPILVTGSLGANGTFVVTSVPAANQLTYVSTTNLGGGAGGNVATPMVMSQIVSTQRVFLTTNAVITTAGPHGFVAGQNVYLATTTAGGIFNGTFNIISTTATTFTIGTLPFELNPAPPVVPQSGRAIFVAPSVSLSDAIQAAIPGTPAPANFTNGNDYQPLPGIGSMVVRTIVVPAGQTQFTLPVEAYQDFFNEANEKVTVVLDSVTALEPATTIVANNNNQSIDASKATDIVTIEDTDFGIKIARTDSPATEPGLAGPGGFNGRFTVSIPNPLPVGTNLVVTLNDVNGLAPGLGQAELGVDYTYESPNPSSPSQTVTILGGQTSAFINVVVIDDLLSEGNEAVDIEITGFTAVPSLQSPPTPGPAALYVATGTATETIFDNDNQVVTVSTTAGKDNGGPLGTKATDGKFTFNQPFVSPYDTVIQYTITSGKGSASTATPGSDYTTIPSGKITITAGSTTADLKLEVIDDIEVEGNEFVELEITGVSTIFNPVTGKGNKGVATIEDGDTATLKIYGSADTSEPAGVGFFTVELSNPASTTTVIGYSVTGGTAKAGTAPGTDIDYKHGPFTPGSDAGFVTFTAGQTQALIAVTVFDDLVIEADPETVEITLAGSTKSGDPQITVSGNAADQKSTIDIFDNDHGRVTIVANQDGKEGGANGKFTLGLVDPSGLAALTSDLDIVVTYQISGTAKGGPTNTNVVNGPDYNSTTVTGTVTIPATKSTASIDVSVFDDDFVELTENLKLSLVSATAASPRAVEVATPTVAITDRQAFPLSPTTSTARITAPGHTFVPGQRVVVATGDASFDIPSGPAANNPFVVTAVNPGVWFEYVRNVPTAVASTPTSGIATLTAGVASVTSKAVVANVATLTTAATHSFAPGQIVVVSIGDAIYDGTFQILTTAPTSFTYSVLTTTSPLVVGALGTAATLANASINILDNDSAELTISGGSFSEGNKISDQSKAALTVTLTKAFDIDTTFNVTFNSGSNGTVAASTTSIASGVATIAVPGHTFAVGQLVNVALTPPAANTVFNGPQLITAVVPGVSISFATASADQASAPATGNVTGYGMATPGGIDNQGFTDFNGSAIPVTFKAGQTSAVVQVDINEEDPAWTKFVGGFANLVEDNEKFFTKVVSVTPLAGYAFTNKGESTVTILNDDTATYTIDDKIEFELNPNLPVPLANGTVARASNVATITTGVAHGLAIGSTVEVAFSPASATFDGRYYVATATTLTAPNVGGNLAAAAYAGATVTTFPQATLTFTVSVDNPVDMPIDVLVNYTDDAGVLGAKGADYTLKVPVAFGTDYDSSTDTASFGAGSTTSKTVSVLINSDYIVEGGTVNDPGSETFTAKSSIDAKSFAIVPQGGRLFNNADTGTGTIQDQLPGSPVPGPADTAHVLISVTDGLAAETTLPTPANPGQIRIYLIDPVTSLPVTSSSPTVVNFSLATGGTNAIQGVDYDLFLGATKLGSSVTIPANASQVLLDVKVIDDSLLEIDEFVRLSITTLGDRDPNVNLPLLPLPEATVQINDNDVATLSVTATKNGSEPGGGANNGELTFALTKMSDSDTVITYRLLDPNNPADVLLGAQSPVALPGVDYKVLSGTVTISANKLSATVPVEVLPDFLSEPTEKVSIYIETKSGNPDISFGTRAATVDITDAATGLFVKVQPLGKDGSEPGNANQDGQFVLQIVDSKGNPTVIPAGSTTLGGISVNLVYGGKATQPGDYVAPTVVFFPENTSTIPVTIDIGDDLAPELPEQVLLTLQSISAGTLDKTGEPISLHATDTNSSLTIFDNDAPVGKVDSVKINDGNVQRSAIKSLTVTIDGVVNAPASAFIVRKRDDSPGGAVYSGTVAGVIASANYLAIPGKTVVTLTFAPNSTYVNAAGKLVDGNYELEIDALQVTTVLGGYPLDGNGDGIGGDNYKFGDDAVDKFYVLYGDADGDEDVDFDDMFGLVFPEVGTTNASPTFKDYLDGDLDGDIDFDDMFGQVFPKVGTLRNKNGFPN